jgi:general secretion pathway protein G
MDTNNTITLLVIIGIILMVVAVLVAIVYLMRRFDWWIEERCEKWIEKDPEGRRVRVAVYFSMAAFISAIIGVIVALIALKFPYRLYPEFVDIGFRLIVLFCVIVSIWAYSFCRSIKRGFRIIPPALRWTPWLYAIVIMMSAFSLLFCVLVQRLGGPSRNANVTAARISISAISVALDQYARDTGSYPTEQQGLAVLTNSPQNGKSSYLERMPRTPWGEFFLYHLVNGKPVVVAMKPDGSIISNQPTIVSLWWRAGGIVAGIGVVIGAVVVWRRRRTELI